MASVLLRYKFRRVMLADKRRRYRQRRKPLGCTKGKGWRAVSVGCRVDGVEQADDSQQEDNIDQGVAGLPCATRQ